MEYKRKNRWANYGTDKCKEYLRNDFSHECAYCKLQEKEVGLIDSNYFEIDHFIPQSYNELPINHHLYSNLYYSCEKCNREKSNIWSEELLDPCKEFIFSGECPPVTGGYDPNMLYKYKAENKRGELYINTFKLNSRHHINIRKRRINRENNIKIIDGLISEIIQKFSEKKIDDLSNLINKLDKLRSIKTQEISNLPSDENFNLVEKYLQRNNIKSSIIFEEHNIDIKVKIGNNSYYCELIVDRLEKEKEEKKKFLYKEKLEVWYKNLNYKFGILFYYPNLDKLYLYPISDIIKKKDLEKYGTKKQIKLTEEFLI